MPGPTLLRKSHSKAAQAAPIAYRSDDECVGVAISRRPGSSHRRAPSGWLRTQSPNRGSSYKVAWAYATGIWLQPEVALGVGDCLAHSQHQFELRRGQYTT
jgi:hypothetical protein